MPISATSTSLIAAATLWFNAGCIPEYDSSTSRFETTLARGQTRATSIAVDTHHVYWIDEGRGLLLRAGKRDGVVSVVSSGHRQPRNLQLSTDHAYWMVDTVTDARVLRLGKLDRRVETVAYGLGHGSSFALGSDIVFVMNTSDVGDGTAPTSRLEAFRFPSAEALRRSLNAVETASERISLDETLPASFSMSAREATVWWIAGDRINAWTVGEPDHRVVAIIEGADTALAADERGLWFRRWSANGMSVGATHEGTARTIATNQPWARSIEPSSDSVLWIAHSFRDGADAIVALTAPDPSPRIVVQGEPRAGRWAINDFAVDGHGLYWTTGAEVKLAPLEVSARPFVATAP